MGHKRIGAPYKRTIMKIFLQHEIIIVYEVITNIYNRIDNRNKIKLGQCRKSLGNSNEYKDEVTINATAKRI